MLIDEQLALETQGASPVETSPGVYYYYDSDDTLLCTVRIRDNHYTIKYRGAARVKLYDERAILKTKMDKELGIETILDEINKPTRIIKNPFIKYD